MEEITVATNLAEMVEVVEGGLRAANAYLTHGYKLLRIDTQSSIRSSSGPEGEPKKAGAFVLRRLSWVLGRDQNTPQFTYERKEAAPPG